LSLPIPRLRLGSQPELITPLAQAMPRVLERHLLAQVGLAPTKPQLAVALKRFGSAVNLNATLYVV
jgi:hypothetical protein